MKKIKARGVIARSSDMSGNTGYISIEIDDAISGLRIVSCELDSEQFVKMLTACYTEFEAEVYPGYQFYGMKRETKDLIFQAKIDEKINSEEAFLEIAKLKVQIPAGWELQSDLVNYRRSIKKEGEFYMMRIRIERFKEVEATTETKEV